MSGSQAPLIILCFAKQSTATFFNYPFPAQHCFAQRITNRNGKSSGAAKVDAIGVQIFVAMACRLFFAVLGSCFFNAAAAVIAILYRRHRIRTIDPGTWSGIRARRQSATPHNRAVDATMQSIVG
jgi:hypothetical protein